MTTMSIANRRRIVASTVWIILALLWLAGCRNEQPDATSPSPTLAGTAFADISGTPAAPDAALATDTAVPPTPSPTPPLAASVNGRPIYQQTLDEAMARRNKGLQGVIDPELPEEEATALVLDMLIELALIEQAAAENGITISEELVAAEMDELRRLAEESGGAGGYEAWLQSNGWTEAELEAALVQQLLTEQVMALVTADVPEAVPQAHARYLQVADAALAQSLWEQLQAGADFAALARQYSLDRATGEDGGDLGYFPAGLLLVPEIEQAAFSLQPGEISEVITVTNEDGTQSFYLVQLIELDPARPLSADTRAILLQERFESWLAEQWANADIVLFEDGGT